MTHTRRALLSVSDKTGLTELGRGLIERGFSLVASGGTAKALRDAGLDVTPVEAVTGAPEMLGGRVKTLHPAIHGGILAKRTEAHLAELAERGLAPIDAVFCNLYPFAQTVSKPGTSDADAIEQIDIGGVALLRAAAKNFESVTVVCDPADYGRALESLGGDGPDRDMRRTFALKAFRHTSSYDAAISTWLGATDPHEPMMPSELHLTAIQDATLRYGENPHQAAALYAWAPGSVPFVAIRGKALSYNNILDINAAWSAAEGFDRPAVVIVKHSNPCGLAIDDDVIPAFHAALASDPVSAFGSIIAVNRTVEVAFVEALGKLFVEAIVAPEFTPEAVSLLAKRKKNCRVVEVNPHDAEPLVIRTIRGGLLVQTPDLAKDDPAEFRTVTKRVPTDEEWAAIEVAWAAVVHVKSNAIVFAKDNATVGVGAGQMNRVDAVRLAGWRAGERAQGAVMASDAFFPFPDGIEAAHDAGITAVIQPGGSIRDEKVIARANELGLAMVFTGARHFQH